MRGYISKKYNLTLLLILFFAIFSSCSDMRNKNYDFSQIDSSCKAYTCHTATPLGVYPPSSGKHTVHLESRTGISCDDCHNGYDGNPLHKNGLINGYDSKTNTKAYGDIIFFKASTNPNGSWDNNSNTCGNLSCHLPVNWFATNTTDCTLCHSAGLIFDTYGSGAHTKHAITVGYVCEKCHYNYNSNVKHKDGNLDNAAASPSMIAFDSLNPSGSYTPASQACNNLYCHGNFTGGINTTPLWTGTVNCTTGMCHNNPQTYTSHNRHTVDYSYTCSQCHKDRGYNTAYHINGARDVNFDSFNPSGSYSSPNCSNLYCHGNFTGGNNASPAWGGTVVCAAGCHNNPHTYTTHNKHTSLPYSYACSTCHFNRGYATSYHLNGTKEVNFNPGGLATRNGLDTNTPAYNDGSKVCNDVYCHSNGISADRATDGTYTWGPLPFGTMSYASPAWNGSDFTDCDNCHAGPGYMYTKGPAYIIIDSIDGNMISSDFFVGRDEFPNSGSHRNGAHFDNDRGTYLDNNTQWAVVQCFWCHETDGNDPSGGNKRQGTYGTSFHVDGQTHFIPTHYYDGGTMVGNTLLNMKDTAYDYSGGHCATVSWRCW